MADDWRLTQPADSYVARMANEYNELNERREKLGIFFTLPIFNKLPDEKKELMYRPVRFLKKF